MTASGEHNHRYENLSIGLDFPPTAENLAHLQTFLDQTGGTASHNSGFYPKLHYDQGLSTWSGLRGDKVELSIGALPDVSQELFGSTVYGASANSWLGYLRSTSYLDRHTLRTPPEVTERTPDLTQYARGIWEKKASPFEFVLRDEGVLQNTHTRQRKWLPPKKETFSYRKWGVEAGEVTTRSLQHFIESNGFGAHTLRGTLGKMIAVIETAGGRSPRAVQETDQQFMTARALSKLMVKEGLSEYYRRQIHGSIRYALAAQLESGRPGSHGEVVVEGKLTHGDFSTSIAYQRIGLASLGSLLPEHPDDNPAREFLAHISAT